ncbi:interleukin-31 receptor subunit alpha-like [Alligator mississippiensis]|uniref:Interleukin-31 receptor subunit alpha-like n=2 Tax=Alligator mississippiensis TaxID=8496 RepID=A0A151MXK5_ALLMI|nr:interleukin-31 receptor subunit alpha-like [Alligator mississippiensis]
MRTNVLPAPASLHIFLENTLFNICQFQQEDDEDFSVLCTSKKKKMKSVLLLVTMCRLIPDYSDCSSCHLSCKQLPEWDGELACHIDSQENLLCYWLPVSSAQGITNYTITLKWDKIKKCLERNISSSSIKVERSCLYMNRPVTIWVSVIYSAESCVKTKNISFIPSKAVKCGSPSNINAHQVSNKFVIKWDPPKTYMQYELRYKEVLPASSEWIVVPIANNAVNVTVSGLHVTSSYIAQLRCIPNDEHHCVCVWSREVVVPHKLTEKPMISYTTITELPPGRRSVFLKWKTTQNRNVIGYYVNVERIPNSCNKPPSHISLTEEKLHLNLSMAYYRLNISAYNAAGESPQTTYIVPNFTTTVLGQLNAIPQGNNTVITWTPEYNPQCFIVDWGTGKEDMHMKIITKPVENFTLGHLQPYVLYKIMVHASDTCQCENFMRHERTFGATRFYSVEGVPQIGPANVTFSNVRKHSALVRWTAIPAEDCLGFLQGYRINCTDTMKTTSLAVTVNYSTTSYLLQGLKEKTVYRVQISGITSAGEGSQSQPQSFSTLKYDTGEFEGIVTALCLGIMFTMIFIPIICSLMLRRSKRQCWPSVPNPRNSSTIQEMARTNPEDTLGPISISLLQIQSDNDTTSLHVIEWESKASWELEPFEGTKEDSEPDKSQFEVARGSPDTSANASKISEKETAAEKERASSTIRTPLLSDYTNVEFSQKAMLNLIMNHPAKSASPHMETKLNNEENAKQHFLFVPQDYVKQNQVVFMPTGPTLVETVTCWN